MRALHDVSFGRVQGEHRMLATRMGAVVFFGGDHVPLSTDSRPCVFVAAAALVGRTRIETVGLDPWEMDTSLLGAFIDD